MVVLARTEQHRQLAAAASHLALLSSPTAESSLGEGTNGGVDSINGWGWLPFNQCYTICKSFITPYKAIVKNW